MARYPDRYSAALPALASAQKVHGWCSPLAIHQTAAVMQVTPAYLSSVATFYDMLRTEPGADRYVFVCTSVACHLRNAKAVVRGDRRGGPRPGPGGRGPARVRVPGRVRHGTDGLDRRPLRGPAGRERRARADRRREGEAPSAARPGPRRSDSAAWNQPTT
ncbi:MAG: NAD(P)H-dependent oxidoreductase subunit E [Thermoleophilaceae bacterium]